MKRISFFILFLMAQWMVAQEVLTPMDVAQLKSVIMAEITPDGKHIIYGLAVPSDPTEENAPMAIQLHHLTVKSRESKPLMTENSISDLRMRPGHNSLTFTSRMGEDKVNALYELPLSGGEAVKIYQFDASISDYAWHPEGKRLAFIATMKPEQDSGALPYQPEIYEEQQSMAEVFLTDLSKDSPQAEKLKLGVHANHLHWSPDGQMIALTAAPSTLIDDYYTSQKIHILNAQGQKQSTVDHTAKLGSLAWSPDSKHIAFLGGEDKNDPTPGRLFVVTAQGGKPQLLNRDFKGSFDQVAWADKSTLMFLASEGTATTVGSMDLKGKIKKMMETGELAFSSISAAEDGELALVGSSAKHPGEVYFAKSAKDDARRMTDHNPWLKDRKLGRQEVYRYKADDGTEIEGILIHPVDKMDGQRYPLITVVHGGPEAHYNNGWLTNYSMPGQMAAGKGYAVFYPNYRGSTGRGVDFARSSQGDPGGKEFDDIIHGIDHLIDDGLVDKDRVGVTGGSYGGYATAWMSTKHSDRFAAGVMFVGISNNISKWGTSDIPEEMFLVHSLKRIWDDYDFFLKRSPIYYADQAKTPLLIMHGKEDTRVNPGQSYELYRHIKTRTDTPVRLVLYPGEGHGNRSSTARYDYSQRMLRWFDTYLKQKDAEMPPPELSMEMK